LYFTDHCRCTSFECLIYHTLCNLLQFLLFSHFCDWWLLYTYITAKSHIHQHLSEPQFFKMIFHACICMVLIFTCTCIGLHVGQNWHQCWYDIVAIRMIGTYVQIFTLVYYQGQIQGRFKGFLVELRTLIRCWKVSKCIS